MKNSPRKDGDVEEGHHENGNEADVGLLASGDALHHEIVPSDAGNHEHESDPEYEHLENCSLEVGYTEEPSETTDGISVHDHYKEPEELPRSHSPESIDPASDLSIEGDAGPEPLHEVSGDAVDDEELKQGREKDDIADIVGLLESTSFTSKHILQGSDEGAVNDSLTPGLDKERQRIGEIPDEE